MNDERPSASPSAARETQQGVDRRLLEILVCPVTRASLRYDATRQELVSNSAHVAFPIRGGVPVMITDEARACED
jgi:uncharacterized protein YbaR (Trm112 family)